MARDTTKRDKWLARGSRLWRTLLFLALLGAFVGMCVTMDVAAPPPGKEPRKPVTKVVPPPEPAPEICNDVDDDLDGDTDENLTQDCRTLCGEGMETCIAGDWVHCSAPESNPDAEDCDYNCDGVPDKDPCCEQGERKDEVLCAPKPRDFVWVVDQSGSMERSDPFDLSYSGLAALIPKLDKDDRVGMVVYSDEAQKVSDLVDDHSKLSSMVSKAITLRAWGGTMTGLALTEAAKLFTDKSRRRVIWLLTDGSSSDDDFLPRAELKADGIEVINLYLGYYSSTGGSVFDQSRGNDYYIAQANDIPRVYQQVFDSMKYASWVECTPAGWTQKYNDSCEPAETATPVASPPTP